MFIRKDIVGGRGFGVFHIARLDYVEKLQNYDWVIVDLNIFDCYPDIENKNKAFDFGQNKKNMHELTRLHKNILFRLSIPLVKVHILS